MSQGKESGRDARERRVLAAGRKQKIRSAAAVALGAVAVFGLFAGARAGLFSPVAEALDEDPAPDFTLMTSEGDAFHLRETNGSARVLFFMTTSDWCQPCKIMTRGPLGDVRARYNESDVTMLSIEMIPDERSNADLERYKVQYGGKWPHARDTEGVARAYGMKFLSVVVILDQEGFVKFTAADPSASDMIRAIEKMGIKPQGARS